MLSRTAASFYWIGRYTERAEYNARLVNVHYHMLIESVDRSDHVPIWQRRLENMGELDRYTELYGDITTTAVLEYFTIDARNPNAMVNLVAAARENARGIQDQLSSEVWHHINAFHLAMKDLTPEDLWRNPHDLLVKVRDVCYTLHGVIGSTMMHDEGWSFYRLGKDMERTGRTARLLAHPVLIEAAREPAAMSEYHQCVAVLKSASAYEAYRKVYRSAVVPVKVVDFLLLNDRFPRSVHFCARSLRTVINRLSARPDGPESREPERLIGQLAADLDFVSLEEVYDIGLSTFLDEVVARLDRIGAAIARTYFRQGDPSPIRPAEARRHRIPIIHAPTLQEMQSVLAIRHHFVYKYESPVAGVRTMMRLAPNQRYGRQRLLDVRWHMEPPGDYRHYTDAFGNLVWQMDHTHIQDTVDCTVEMRVENRANYVSEGVLAIQGTSPHETDSIVEPAEFTSLTTLVDSSEGLQRLAQRVKDRGGTPMDLADAIMHQVGACLKYEPGRTHVATTASEALALAGGVCQDFAHVMIALCRMLDLPARYVSGYLPAEGQMHAWLEVLLPVGHDQSPVWVAYDPLHQRRCDERYVTVAVGRDYQDISPTSGYYYGDAKNSLVVKVSATLESRGPAGRGLASMALEAGPDTGRDSAQQQQQQQQQQR
ncbi:MAG: alpha-E domain-containing protein [Candidatus Sericytochromatia bacterium]|nr:alpha-E domain-containing protein [Candidatus Sericytochromatia bacterium]